MGLRTAVVWRSQGAENCPEERRHDGKGEMMMGDIYSVVTREVNEVWSGEN
jgi:hypothetical protein